MNRRVLFWTVCIPVRLVTAAIGPPRALALALGVWWVAFERRTRGFFGGHAWWAPLRPLHGALWLAYAHSGDKRWLWGDAALGAQRFTTCRGPMRR